jgi:CelD/BcsL family acetyltransferase involved in cellulose biosynthesis
MIGRGRGRFARPIRYLMFLGQNQEVYPEYLDFITERGREREICTALAEHLLEQHQHRFDVVCLERVLAEAACAPIWRAAFARGGVDLTPTNEVPSTTVELPTSFEAYMARRSGRFRRHVAKCDRRVRAEAPIGFLLAPKDIAVDRALDEIVRLNHSRWGEMAQSFRTAGSVEFHRRIAPLLVEKGEALLMLMTLGERIVAGRYDFVYGGKALCYQGGWLPEYERWSLGTVLLARVIQWSIEKGLKEYDFLGGAARYKQEWGTATRQMVDYIGYRRTLVGQAFRLAMRGKAELKTRLNGGRLEKLRVLTLAIGR